VDGLNELIRRARLGDCEAWGHLEAEFGPHLLRVAQHLLGPNWPDKSCRDVVQDAWLRIVQNFDSFRGAAGDAQTAAVFRAWITQTLRNAWANDVRGCRTKRRSPPAGKSSGVASAGNSSDSPSGPELPAPDPTPSRVISSKEVADLVRVGLDRLVDPEEREVLRLHYLEGVPLRRIARSLGLSYDQVRTRCQKARQNLKRELGYLR
jgi:RNA polymerase sigma factor (sigma-70 family)